MAATADLDTTASLTASTAWGPGPSTTINSFTTTTITITNSSSDSTDIGESIYDWLRMTTVVPVTVLGVVFNSLASWVWLGDQSRCPITFLFQYQMIWDTIFLLLALVFFILREVEEMLASKVVYLVFFLAQLVSIHTTVVITVSRWLAVSMPLHVHLVVTRRRAALTCVAVLAWCLVVTAVETVRRHALPEEEEEEGETSVALYVSVRVLGLVLPLLIMLAFSLALIYHAYRYARSSPPAHHHHHHHRDQSSPSEAKQHKLTLAVLSMACCSFLAYPVSTVAQMMSKTGSLSSVCSPTCYYLVKGVSNLLQNLNSGVSFFFFFFFASRFRVLLRQRLCSPRGARALKREASSSMSTVSSAGTAAGNEAAKPV